MTASDHLLTTTAADLVAALWRDTTPAMGADDASPTAPTLDLRAALSRISADADVLADRASAVEQPAARLLAETARAACNALDGSSPSRAGTLSGNGMLPSSARLRLARMEQWLSNRAMTDPNAEAAANLCLWVLDHLECGPE